MSSAADWPVSAEGADTPAAALQLALDLTSLDRAADLVAKLSPTLGRIEIGTPLAIAAGLAAIERIRPLYGYRLAFDRLAVAGKLTPAQTRPALEAGFGTLIAGSGGRR